MIKSNGLLLWPATTIKVRPSNMASQFIPVYADPQFSILLRSLLPPSTSFITKYSLDVVLGTTSICKYLKYQMIWKFYFEFKCYRCELNVTDIWINFERVTEIMNYVFYCNCFISVTLFFDIYFLYLCDLSTKSMYSKTKSIRYLFTLDFFIIYCIINCLST